VVQALLSAKADVQATNEYVLSLQLQAAPVDFRLPMRSPLFLQSSLILFCRNGDMPLHFADKLPVINTLVAAKADVQAKNQCVSLSVPLHSQPTCPTRPHKILILSISFGKTPLQYQLDLSRRQQNSKQ
jgi:hypothetical protein